jgi:hypothetical protein
VRRRERQLVRRVEEPRHLCARRCVRCRASGVRFAFVRRPDRRLLCARALSAANGCMPTLDIRSAYLSLVCSLVRTAVACAPHCLTFLTSARTRSGRYRSPEACTSLQQMIDHAAAAISRTVTQTLERRRRHAHVAIVSALRHPPGRMPRVMSCRRILPTHIAAGCTTLARQCMRVWGSLRA